MTVLAQYALKWEISGYGPNVRWIHFDSVHPADAVRHRDSKFAEQCEHRHYVDVTSYNSSYTHITHSQTVPKQPQINTIILHLNTRLNAN